MKSIHIKHFLTLASVLTLAVVLISCSSMTSKTEVAEPLTQNLAGNDADSQMEFWHALYERKVTSNDEAFHALLLFLKGTDDAADYAGRVEAMTAGDMLPSGFDRPANEAVTRGTLAVAIVKAMQLKGGLTLCAFPKSPRYATRELQYAGIYPLSSPHQTFSGGQFVSIIGRLEDYQRVNPPDELPPDQLPANPGNNADANVAPPAPELAPAPAPEAGGGEAAPQAN